MKPTKQLHRTPPGKENNGHVATPGKAQTPACRALDLEQVQQDLREQFGSQQQQLSQLGLTSDLPTTVKALDIELAQARQEHVQLEATVTTIQSTLDKLGSAVIQDGPTVQQQVAALSTRLDDMRTLLQQLLQRLTRVESQQAPPAAATAAGPAWLVVHASQGTSPDAVQQAVSHAAGCNTSAVLAVLPLSKRTQQGPSTATAGAGAAAAGAAATIGRATAATSGAAAASSSYAAAAAGPSNAAAGPAPSGRCSYLVKVAASQVRERALQGKNRLRHLAAHRRTYLEPKRTPEQQRAYKQLYGQAQRLKQQGTRYRWTRDSTGVETGLQRQRRDGSWEDTPAAPAPPPSATPAAAASTAKAPATAAAGATGATPAHQGRSQPQGRRKQSPSGPAAQQQQQDEQQEQQQQDKQQQQQQTGVETRNSKKKKKKGKQQAGAGSGST